jgi:hypothetical protein
MGWRLGNGIGPRVSLRQRRLQDLQASSPYGTRAAITEVKITEEDAEADKHTYASRDTPVLIVERKDNAHGVGYRPEMTLHESLGSSGQGNTKGPHISGLFFLEFTVILVLSCYFDQLGSAWEHSTMLTKMTLMYMIPISKPPGTGWRMMHDTQMTFSH